MRALFLIALFFCINSQAREKLVITGSSTVAPVISDLAKLYESTHDDVRIDVQTGGSSRGIQDARRGSANIGMVSRSLKEKEGDLNGFVVAKDGLAVIVHKSNRVGELSSDQIQKIYSGTIKNWKEVGGADKPIVVVNKAEGRSTLELFLKFFRIKNSDIKASIVIGDNEQGIKTVSRNPYSIAYVSVGAAEYNASVGVPLKLLKFKGVEASVKNVANGSYPLMRNLTLVTKMKPMGLAKNFIDFVLSKQSGSVIREHYFVPSAK